MIRINRIDLPLETQNQLEQLQQAVDLNTAEAIRWEDFNKTGTYKSLMREMNNVFHRKCAYCETAGHPRSNTIGQRHLTVTMQIEEALHACFGGAIWF